MGRGTILLFALLCLLVLNTQPLFAQVAPELKFKCIVLDPGHGGKDYGCISKDRKYNEKSIVLSVAKKLGKMIEDNYPDIKVVYTRKSDVFIPLAQRANIANKNKADLFLSIHVNSTAGNNSAHGTETFTMGNHVSDSNFELSKRENSVILMEDDYTTKYEGFNPNSPESYIIFSLLQNAYSEQSIKFANMIQSQFKKGPIKYSRGVKQAGFLVLKNTTMPSVLTELGFISNPDDLKQLTSENGQNLLARRLFNAFEEYKREFENLGGPIANRGENEEDEKEMEKEDKNENRNENSIVRVIEDKAIKESKEVRENTKDIAKRKITYHIQIMSLGKKLPTNSAEFKREKVNYLIENKIYKYYVGDYATRDQALRDLDRVRLKFKGAFIIGVSDGKIVER